MNAALFGESLKRKAVLLVDQFTVVVPCAWEDDHPGGRNPGKASSKFSVKSIVLAPGVPVG
jgi:hypothetical protein